MTDVALDPKALEKAAKAAYEGVYPSVAWSDSVAQEWWLECAELSIRAYLEATGHVPGDVPSGIRK